MASKGENRSSMRGTTQVEWGFPSGEPVEDLAPFEAGAMAIERSHQGSTLSLSVWKATETRQKRLVRRTSDASACSCRRSLLGREPCHVETAMLVPERA